MAKKRTEAAGFTYSIYTDGIRGSRRNLGIIEDTMNDETRKMIEESMRLWNEIEPEEEQND